jgi:hypothetical protein
VFTAMLCAACWCLLLVPLLQRLTCLCQLHHSTDFALLSLMSLTAALMASSASMLQ